MASDSNWLKEVFREFGAVETRKMFGGTGIFYQGLMIALEADDVLYLKTDAENIHEFERHGLSPFQYQKGEKTVKMSYSEAPAETLEDPFEMKVWAESANKAAVRSDELKKKITR